VVPADVRDAPSAPTRDPLENRAPMKKPPEGGFSLCCSAPVQTAD
jgi:hypothetical protein